MPALHPHIKAALIERASQLNQSAHRWCQAFSLLLPYLPATSVVDQKKIISQLDRDSDCHLLVQLLSATHHTPSWWPDLIQQVDASASTLSQWLDAFSPILAWWQQHHPGSRPSLQQLAGYLSCCAEYDAGRSVRISLRHTVEEMLADYGMQGEADSGQ